MIPKPRDFLGNTIDMNDMVVWAPTRRGTDLRIAVIVDVLDAYNVRLRFKPKMDVGDFHEPEPRERNARTDRLVLIGE